MRSLFNSKKKVKNFNRDEIKENVRNCHVIEIKIELNFAIINTFLVTQVIMVTW